MADRVRKFVERIMEDGMTGASMTSAGTQQYENGPISPPMRKGRVIKKTEEDYDPEDLDEFNIKYFADMD